jgi:hypothetical protein
MVSTAELQPRGGEWVFVKDEIRGAYTRRSFHRV